jgi:hypothetical protein
VLADSLINSSILWIYLGMSSLVALSVNAWMKNNTDRDNFYLNAADLNALSPLEKDVRAGLGPSFEGG